MLVSNLSTIRYQIVSDDLLPVIGNIARKKVVAVNRSSSIVAEVVVSAISVVVSAAAWLRSGSVDHGAARDGTIGHFSFHTLRSWTANGLMMI